MLTVEGGDVLGLLDDAYDLQVDETAWGARIMARLMKMSGSPAAVTFRLRTRYASDGRLVAATVGAPGTVGTVREWTDATTEAVSDGPYCETSFGRTVGATLSTLAGLPQGFGDIPQWRACWDPPFVDALGLVSRDAHGDIICICAGLAQPIATRPAHVQLLTRVASHVGTADRLRRHTEAPSPEVAEAVLTPAGKLVHAKDPRAEARAALDDGHARRTFARKNRAAPEKALDVWQGLVAGRWSLVDFLDSDGRRFVLAMKNTPKVAPRAELTPRERRVASLVAMGHRDKEIAYMLGLTLAAVSTSFRRARIKLGVESRAELATVWRRSERK